MGLIYVYDYKLLLNKDEVFCVSMYDDNDVKGISRKNSLWWW